MHEKKPFIDKSRCGSFERRLEGSTRHVASNQRKYEPNDQEAGVHKFERYTKWYEPHSNHGGYLLNTLLFALTNLN